MTVSASAFSPVPGGCLALKDAADAARAAGHGTIDQETLDRQAKWYADDTATGIALNARRKGRLQEKRHAPGHPDEQPRRRLPPLRP